MTRLASGLAAALGAALALAAGAAAQDLSEEHGFDRRGDDYRSFAARDLRDCQDACREDRRCAAYSFNVRASECFLKDGTGLTQRRADTISGVKLDRPAPGGVTEPGNPFPELSEERGYDRPGHDFHSFRASGLRPCQEECARDRRCAAYSFNTRTETCYLKDQVGSIERRADTVSGVKRDLPGEEPGDRDGPGRHRVRLTEEWGYDQRGNDIDSFRARGLAACQAACREEARCAAYSFNTRSETCYLKDAPNDLERRDDTVTGSKEGWGRPGRHRVQLTEEWGYDQRGNDIDSFRTQGLAACQEACREEARCAAYSFNTRSETCYLKDAPNDLERRDDTVTGTKEGWGRPGHHRVRLTEEWGYDQRGNDIDSFRTQGLAACQEACREEARCAAYSFNTRSETCYLKDAPGYLERRDDTVTGTKEY